MDDAHRPASVDSRPRRHTRTQTRDDASFSQGPHTFPPGSSSFYAFPAYQSAPPPASIPAPGSPSMLDGLADSQPALALGRPDTIVHDTPSPPPVPYSTFRFNASGQLLPPEPFQSYPTPHYHYASISTSLPRHVPQCPTTKPKPTSGSFRHINSSGRATSKAPIPYPWIMHGIPGVTRVRTSHACENCRKRKTKCSGDQPTCGRCEQAKIECHYEIRYRRSRKSPSPIPESEMFSHPPNMLPDLQSSLSFETASSASLLSDGGHTFDPHFHFEPHVLDPHGYVMHDHPALVDAHSMVAQYYPGCDPQLVIPNYLGSNGPFASHVPAPADYMQVCPQPYTGYDQQLPVLYGPSVPPVDNMDHARQPSFSLAVHPSFTHERHSSHPRCPSSGQHARIDSTSGPLHEAVSPAHSASWQPSATSHSLNHHRRSPTAAMAAPQATSTRAASLPDAHVQQAGTKRHLSATRSSASPSGATGLSRCTSPPRKACKREYQTDHQAAPRSSAQATAPKKLLHRLRTKAESPAFDGFPPEVFIKREDTDGPFLSYPSSNPSTGPPSKAPTPVPIVSRPVHASRLSALPTVHEPNALQLDLGPIDMRRHPSGDGAYVQSADGAPYAAAVPEAGVLHVHAPIPEHVYCHPQELARAQMNVRSWIDHCLETPQSS